MSEWRVAWSHQIDGPVNDVKVDTSGMLICTGQSLIALRPDGTTAWRSDHVFDTYSLETSGSSVALLTGTSIHILNRSTGKPLSDGRSIPGGYREVLHRVGGGWIAPDRGDHLHLFRENGRGIRRLRVGPTRMLIGWMDREHLLCLDHDGFIRCIRLHGEHAQRVIEDRRWTWCSRLEGGRMLLLDSAGALYEGVPNPFGWDEISRISDGGLDPHRATRAGDGWWTMDLEGRISHEIDGKDAGFGESSVDYAFSDGSGVIVSATREGLIRWSESPSLSGMRLDNLRTLETEERRRLDWMQRTSMFESAQQAEEEGLWSRALELYRALGRAEDVRRVLGLQEGSD
tara:strand:+ start:315 stop:1346 length:1032 start_codon:yes stop_codon:yes gene_type:complete